MVEIRLSDAQVEIDDMKQKKDAKARLALDSQLIDGEIVDLILVRQLRELMRDEYEQNEQLYAPIHYEHIMDESSPATCWRYLSYFNMDIDEAFAKMKSSLQWRKKNGTDSLRPEQMLKEFWLHGPIGNVGKTREGRDLFYVICKNYRKPDSKIKHIVNSYVSLLLFNWDTEHRHDFNKVTVVFDTTHTGFRNIDLDFMAWLVSVLDYIPARFNDISVVGVPFLVRPLIRLIISWLPEKYSRLVMCGTMDELVRANVNDDDDLPVEVGGKSDRWRLAPISAKWAHEHEELGTPEITKAFDACIGFHLTDERREQLLSAQLEYERKLRNGSK